MVRLRRLEDNVGFCCLVRRAGSALLDETVKVFWPDSGMVWRSSFLPPGTSYTAHGDPYADQNTDEQ